VSSGSHQLRRLRLRLRAGRTFADGVIGEGRPRRIPEMTTKYQRGEKGAAEKRGSSQ